jgi:hypothetical protein
MDQYGITNYSNRDAWKNFRVMRENEDLGTLWDIRQAHSMSEREGHFRTSLDGAKGASHRSPGFTLEEGYMWINPFCILVQQVVNSDTSSQPLHVIPVSAEVRAEFEKIAAPGCSIFRVDYRTLMSDGIPVPNRPDNFDSDEQAIDGCKDTAVKRDKEWLLTVLENGPQMFPTPFTRQLAGRNGWSHGHAHVGRIGMGFKSLHSDHTRYHPGLLQYMSERPCTYIPSPITQTQKHDLEKIFIQNPEYRKHQTVHIPGAQPGTSPVAVTAGSRQESKLANTDGFHNTFSTDSVTIGSLAASSSRQASSSRRARSCRRARRAVIAPLTQEQPGDSFDVSRYSSPSEHSPPGPYSQLARPSGTALSPYASHNDSSVPYGSPYAPGTNLRWHYSEDISSPPNYHQDVQHNREGLVSNDSPYSSAFNAQQSAARHSSYETFLASLPPSRLRGERTVSKANNDEFSSHVTSDMNREPTNSSDQDTSAVPLYDPERPAEPSTPLPPSYNCAEHQNLDPQLFM